MGEVHPPRDKGLALGVATGRTIIFFLRFGRFALGTVLTIE